jgi:hypothetical protein
MPIDVQDLIDNWERVRNLVMTSHGGSELSPLASLADEKETWEVFAALIGYSQETRENIAAILSQIPDDLAATPIAGIVVPFLRYASGFEISPLSRFLPAVYEVKSKLGRAPILETSEAHLERCLKNSGGDIEEFLKCISEQARGQEQNRKAFEVGAGDDY